MHPLFYKLHDENYGVENVNISDDYKQYIFYYPCKEPHNCTYYEISLLPGVYQFEVYGASGGYMDEQFIGRYRTDQSFCPEKPRESILSNVECNKKNNIAGSGGYTAGIIRLLHKTNAFLFIGGSGRYLYKIEENNNEQSYQQENMIEGGYNGGGWAANFYGAPTSYGSSSGGGATDIRFEVPDLFHRVIVAGGGGGTDDQTNTEDDGSGGAGGGLIAQSFRVNGAVNTELFATQKDGFSFGYGESAQYFRSKHPNGYENAGKGSDIAGAGGGWFGGFASQSTNGGAGGGSSFILTRNADIPTEEIDAYDSFRNEETLQKEKYAFLGSSQYFFTSELMASGVWAGNGFAVITQISSFFITYNKSCNTLKSLLLLLVFIMVH